MKGLFSSTVGLILICFGLLCFACTPPKPAPKAEEKEQEASSLEPIVAGADANIPAYVKQHLLDMADMGKPLQSMCDIMAPQLLDYWTLVEADFDRALELELTDTQKQEITAAYEALSRVAGRCMTDEKGRKINQLLLKKVRPLTTY